MASGGVRAAIDRASDDVAGNAEERGRVVAPSKRGTYLYFFLIPGRIKIGISENVTRRLKDIGAHLAKAPELLGCIESSYAFEKHIHDQLKRYRVKGEWFRDCPAVRSTMESVLAGDLFGFVPPAKKQEIQPQSSGPQDYLAMINRVTAVIWRDPAAELAEAAEIPLKDACDYLVGIKEIPRAIQCVIALEVAKFATPPFQSKKRT